MMTTTGAAPALLWLRRFPGEPQRVRQARHWIAGILPDCDARDILVQLTGELAANAVEHTRSGEPGETFGVHVAWSARAVRVTVGDSGSAAAPAAVAATLEDERMRGLYLVQAMSAAWGFAGDGRGRWVWADVPWSERGGPARIEDDSALPVTEAVRRLRIGCPGIRIGYDGDPAQWWAEPPGARRVSAPCFGALSQMAATARTAPARGALDRSERRGAVRSA